MAAPEFVPNDLSQQPRTGLSLPPSERWVPDRPAELGVEQPTGVRFGKPGPDQGYALSLVRRFEDRLVLSDRESAEDAMAGCVGVALKRASLFGRAPVVHDIEVAFTVWGFLGAAPPELVALRKPLFEAAAHHYWDQRAIVDHVPESTLRLPHAEVKRRFLAEWRPLLGL
jgi:hypothetical protein